MSVGQTTTQQSRVTHVVIAFPLKTWEKKASLLVTGHKFRELSIN